MKPLQWTMLFTLSVFCHINSSGQINGLTKKLFVQPELPSYLRQGDHADLVTRIVNQSDSEITGQVQLQLFDAISKQPVDGWFINIFPNQYFTVAPGKSEQIKFPIQVPFQFNSLLSLKITASTTKSISDTGWSEDRENVLPVLSDNVLISETWPFILKGSVNRKFRIGKLISSGNIETLQHLSLGVEYATDPAVYVLQSLPYLLNSQPECAEQIWNRFYANAIAAKLVRKVPGAKKMIEQWDFTDSNAQASPENNNIELPLSWLHEIPWVQNAMSNEKQKGSNELFLYLERTKHELKDNINSLINFQRKDGSFPWFKGGNENRFITQYIAIGIGHLKKMNCIPQEREAAITSLLGSMLSYLDKNILEDYNKLLLNKNDLSKKHLGSLQVQYLYMRSFFPEQKITQSTLSAYKFYKSQCNKFWMQQNEMEKAMIAISFFRSGNLQDAATIIQMLKKTSIVSEKSGRYWNSAVKIKGWLWNSLPIETQSLLIEAFVEAGSSKKILDELITWLISKKEINNWNTTKATAEACYAILLLKSDLNSNTPIISMKLGNKVWEANMAAYDFGYFEKNIGSKSITPDMGNISVNTRQLVPNHQLSKTLWGAIHWQYYEENNKLTSALIPVKMKKNIFIEKNQHTGTVLLPISEKTTVQSGDTIRVRIELNVDQNMAYMHINDKRPAALDPIEKLNGHKNQQGLNYYQSTSIFSSDFFFESLRKGNYVFEYPLVVRHSGSYSSGITTIRCMYAPEINLKIKGIRMEVGE